MDTERHQRVSELFLRASDLPPEERAALLEACCGDDAALRGEIEGLLARDAAHPSFLETPPTLSAPWAEGARAFPDRIGAYVILDVLGEGGMGIVYRAEQMHPRRIVALKVIKPGVATPTLLKRFEQEALILARLEHPGIAQIFEAGTADIGCGPQPYFAMEYIRGQPLVAYADASGLQPRQRLELFARVCDAVQHAHQKGVIHRDLKASNILVARGAEPLVKIVDFGVARATGSDIQATTIHTGAGQMVGTLPYMSPEQVSGDPHDLDTRSDVYSLGVVLYELLSGRLPFDVDRRMIPELMCIIRDGEPARLSSINRAFRGDVETIVAKAMEKDRNRRYQSASDVAADIRRFLADEPIVARPATSIYQLRKFARRNRGLVAAVAVVLVLSVGAAAGMSVLAFRASRAKDEAQATIDFLDQMLKRVRPEGRAREATLTEILAQASDALDDTVFRDQPEVEVRLREILGESYSALTMHSAAESHFRAMHEVYARRLPDRRRERSEAADALGCCLLDIGQPAEAARCFEEALSYIRAVLDPEGDEAVAVTTNLGVAYLQQRRFDEALQLFHEALDAHVRRHGVDSAQFSLPAFWIAHARLRRRADGDDLAAAESAFRAHVDAALQGTAAETLFDRQYFVYLAWVKHARGELGEAERIIRLAIDRYGSLLGDMHPWIGNASTHLGIVLQAQGRFDEAESLFCAALDRLEKRGSDQGLEIVMATACLADLYVERRDSARARDVLEDTVRRCLAKRGVTLDDIGAWERKATLELSDRLRPEVLEMLDATVDALRARDQATP